MLFRSMGAKQAESAIKAMTVSQAKKGPVKQLSQEELEKEIRQREQILETERRS